MVDTIAGIKSIHELPGVEYERTIKKIAWLDNHPDRVRFYGAVRRCESSGRSHSGGLLHLVLDCKTDAAREPELTAGAKIWELDIEMSIKNIEIGWNR